jgi:general secretion pathway protein B
MSLILEALSRSRQEDQSEGAAPGLDTPAYVPATTEGARWRRYIPWAGLLLALMVIAYLLLDTSGGSGPESVAAPVPDEPVVLSADSLKPQNTTSTLAGKTPAEPAVQDQPTVKTALAVAAVNPVTATKTASPVAATKPVASKDAAVDVQAVAALYAKEGGQGASRTTESAVKSKPGPETVSEPDQPVASKKAVGNESQSQKSIDIEAVLTQTEAELANARLSEHPAPFINSLSQQLKDAIPTIYYSRHDYSSTPGQSTVVLNGQTVRVGGSVKGGVKLDEILPDSVVLSHRGTQFRLRALNSWVNL